MPGTVRKSDLSGRISAAIGRSRADGDKALNAVLGTIRDALARGDRVVLTGFGAFEVRQVKERRVRPIQGRGGNISIPAHRRVGFVPGAELKDAVSGKR